MKWVWISILVIFAICFQVCLDKVNRKNIEKNTIRKPHWFLILGVFGIIGFNIIGMIFLFSQKEVISCIVMVALSSPYSLFILLERNWKIRFTEKGFSFCNMWKRKKDFIYEQVEIVNTGRALRIYCEGKKVVAISLLLENVQEFEKLSKVKKKTIH